jgi:hypothetical protein
VLRVWGKVEVPAVWGSVMQGAARRARPTGNDGRLSSS